MKFPSIHPRMLRRISEGLPRLRLRFDGERANAVAALDEIIGNLRDLQVRSDYDFISRFVQAYENLRLELLELGRDGPAAAEACDLIALKARTLGNYFDLVMTELHKSRVEGDGTPLP